MSRLAVLLMGLALPAQADYLTGPEFAAATRNQTITWGSQSGADDPTPGITGKERYLPGGEVIWQVDGDPECDFGRWVGVEISGKPAICFFYENALNPVCWNVEQGPSGLRAQSVEDETHVFQELSRSDERPQCNGPMVGV